MTEQELVERLTTNRGNFHGTWLETMSAAADAIERLVRERDEAQALNNKYAWERDKAREERDVAERRSEDHWKPRVTAAESRASSAEAQLAEMREALRPFAEAAAGYDPDEGEDRDVAWAHDFTIGSLRRARRVLSKGMRE